MGNIKVLHMFNIILKSSILRPSNHQYTQVEIITSFPRYKPTPTTVLKKQEFGYPWLPKNAHTPSTKPQLFTYRFEFWQQICSLSLHPDWGLSEIAACTKMGGAYKC